MVRLLLAVLVIALCSCASGQDTPADTFDGKRAFAVLERQCGFGPRCPGCPGHEKALQDLIATLRQHADEVTTQRFDHTHSTSRRVLNLTNVIALFRADAKPARETVMIGAHWDTRPTADLEKDPDELENLAGNPDYGSIKSDLIEKLDDWIKENNDPFYKLGREGKPREQKKSQDSKK